MPEPVALPSLAGGEEVQVPTVEAEPVRLEPYEAPAMVPPPRFGLLYRFG